MDTNTPQTSWVEHAVVAMKRTDVYRTQLDDEDYRTVPVPVWNSQQTWLVVGVGIARQAGGPPNPVKTRPPHLVCIVEWPTATIHWIVDNTAERAWPTQPGLPAPVFPADISGRRRDLTVRYYEALSKALEQGAFSARAPDNPPAACAAAGEMRTAFLAAAADENLAPYYAAPLHNINGWIAANCGRPAP